jgi:hypothetical protein
MARITALILDPIRVDVANAHVDAHATVTFNRSDKDANTPYRMVATLLGHDPGGEFAEDAVDDVIADGTLTPAGGQIIRADGLDEPQDFDFPTKTLALRDLNEDTTHNPDDIKVRVVLTPIVATASEAESNVETLTA